MGIPALGSSAPAFTAKAVIDGRIRDVSLKDYAETGEWLVLVFIPMAWSFVCPTEIRAFDRRIQEFETRTASVVFCSTDSEFVLRAWNHTSEHEGGLGGVRIPLLSDRSHQIARNFGVLVESEGVAMRASFIIDPESKIRQVTLNDTNIGRSIDEVRRLLDALMFADEYGEGCPVDWQKGDIGIKMNHNAESSSKRPNHKRTKTWSSVSGWISKGQESSSSLAQSPGEPQRPTALPIQSPVTMSCRPHSIATTNPTAMNWTAMRNNSRFKLEPISSEREAAAEIFFPATSSPLATPKSVFNMMHNHSETTSPSIQSEGILWAKP